MDKQTEKFCQNILAGMTGVDAYCDAFKTGKTEKERKSAAVKAFHLKKRDDVQTRLNDIKTEVRAESNITIHTLLGELEEARQVAKLSESHTGMAKCTILKAQMLGFVGSDAPDTNSGGVDIAFLKTLKNKLLDDE